MPKYKTSTNTDPLKAMYGENSQGVGALQAQLNQKYAGQAGFVPLKVDNKFGPLTQAAMNFKPTTTADKNTPIGQISTVGMDNGNDYYGSIMEKQARGEDIVDTGRIRSDILSSFQDRINATNDIYNRQLAAARQEGVGRVGSGTSLLAARGLTGSMRGGAIKENILDQNRQIEGAIDAERNAAIQNILGMAEQSAIEEAARRREAIQSGASNHINYIKSQGETKRANLENVAGQLIVQGIDPSTIDSKELDGIAKQLGVSTNDIISSYKQKEFEQKQLDAKAQQDAYKALPASAQEYEYAKKGGYTGSFTQYQNEDANRKKSIAAAGVSNSNGFSPAQINSTINSIAGAFDNEPIVKNFNIQNEGLQFIKNLSNTTNNPSDDQGLIYAFAKAMDPGSVVREGEYATVQKYSQSLINSYGESVSQAISGTGFLTPQARANIKKTIEEKVKVSKQNYDNVYKQYQSRIKQAQSGGGNSLTDYSQAYSQTSGTNPDPLGLGI